AGVADRGLRAGRLHRPARASRGRPVRGDPGPGADVRRSPREHQGMTVVPVLPATVLAYDENNIKPGWIALVLVIALDIATFLLWRSMNTQLGRIKAPHRADLPGARKDGAAGTSP